jgi:uncharacterized membrane protein
MEGRTDFTSGPRFHPAMEGIVVSVPQGEPSPRHGLSSLEVDLAEARVTLASRTEAGKAMDDVRLHAKIMVMSLFVDFVTCILSVSKLEVVDAVFWNLYFPHVLLMTLLTLGYFLVWYLAHIRITPYTGWGVAQCYYPYLFLAYAVPGVLQGAILGDPKLRAQVPEEHVPSLFVLIVLDWAYVAVAIVYVFRWKKWNTTYRDQIEILYDDQLTDEGTG